MNISHVAIPFEKLEKVLDLPENAKIVSVKEHDNGRFVVFRVVADTIPDNFSLNADDPLTKIGDAYRGTGVPAIESEHVDHLGPVS